MNKDQATSIYHDLIQGLGYATAIVPQAFQSKPAYHIAFGVAGFVIWAFGTYLSIKFNAPPPPPPSISANN